jgi:hypothetical protein
MVRAAGGLEITIYTVERTAPDSGRDGQPIAEELFVISAGTQSSIELSAAELETLAEAVQRAHSWEVLSRRSMLRGGQ